METIVISAVKKVVVEKVVKNIDKIFIFILVVFMLVMDVVPALNKGVSSMIDVEVSDREVSESVVYGPVVGSSGWGCPSNRKLGINALFGYGTAGYWNGESSFHPGIDFDMIDEEVYSISDGEVVFAGWDRVGLGGWMQVVQYGEFRVWYAHLKDMTVLAGRVKKGQLIAISGNSSSVQLGKHLHLSILKNLQQINPLLYLGDCIK